MDRDAGVHPLGRRIRMKKPLGMLVMIMSGLPASNGAASLAGSALSAGAAAADAASSAGPPASVGAAASTGATAPIGAAASSGPAVSVGSDSSRRERNQLPPRAGRAVSAGAPGFAARGPAPHETHAQKHQG